MDPVIRVVWMAGRPQCRRDEELLRFVGLVRELPERCGTVSHGLVRSKNPVRLRVGTGEEVLTALRARGSGMGPEGAQVHRDRSWFFPVSFRS